MCVPFIGKYIYTEYNKSEARDPTVSQMSQREAASLQAFCLARKFDYETDHQPDAHPLAVALSLLILPGGAASTPEEALGEGQLQRRLPMNYLAVNGRVQTQSYTYFSLPQTAPGKTQVIPAYCVTPDQYGVPQTVPEGESIRYLAEEKASDSKVVGLVANMYPPTAPGGAGA